MTLRTRLTAVGLAVVAASVVVMAAITYGTIRVQARASVDDTLRREADRLTTSLQETLRRATGDDGRLDGAELATAVDAALALNPGSDQHLATVTTPAGTRATDGGPEALVELRDDGDLPEGEADRLVTADTDEGPVRVLRASLATDDGVLGDLAVIAPLADAREDAREALAVVLGAGLVALVLGGTAIVLTTLRALRPLHDLAVAAADVDTDLERRMPVGPRDDEVDTLGTELNRMLDRLADDRERRRIVLGAVSHELRTPLAVARGHLEVFRTLDADADSPAARTAETLEGELARITRLVDDLTAVSRGALGGEVDLGPVFVPDVLDDLRERLGALGDDVVVADAAPPAVIEADAARLGQALLNVVRNAQVHTPEGASVAVGAEADEDEVRLVVADDGPGVDPAVADAVFEPYVSTKEDGADRPSGLGLPIARALVEAQGGRLDLVSRSAGTTVTFRFPRSA